MHLNVIVIDWFDCIHLVKSALQTASIYHMSHENILFASLDIYWGVDWAGHIQFFGSVNHQYRNNTCSSSKT